jgi:hypothetical protein
MVKKIFVASILLTLLTVSVFAPAAEAQPKCNQELETIGVLAGSFVYTSYGYIGASADSFAKDNYTLEELQLIMQEIINLLETATAQLNSLRGLTSQDKKAVAQITLACQYLKQEAMAYSSYAATESDKDFQDYETARNNAWAQIEALMGSAE